MEGVDMKKSPFWIMIAASVIAVSFMIVQSGYAVNKPAGAWVIDTPINVQTSTFNADSPMMTVSGTVTKIEKMPGVKDGIQLRLKSDEGEKWVVWLGPKWFVEHQKIKFMANDKVEVRGKKADSSSIIGTEVSKGDWTMKLRNEEDGLPAWECCFPRKKM
jgi:hypothetical protein